LRAASFFSGTGSELKVDPEKLRRLDPLPGTERELAMLARSLRNGVTALRLGAEATETAVKRDTSLSDAAVVVFATHGLLPGEMGQAAEPGLVLTPPEAADSFDDGLLTASEAAELSLAAQWLILSACNTASPGGEQGAEALSGLARAFLYAGADSLLASHWRVSDDASAELTVQTIRAGQSGRSQAEALQAGQMAVREGIGIDGLPLVEWQAHWAHPAAWAPFALITDYNRLSTP
jgi:CHAT domain-containing protein